MSSSSLPSVSITPSHRPPSVRSVASNSSISSTVSLSRRPRTRTRSRTVTGSAIARSQEQPTSPVSELPYLDRQHSPYNLNRDPSLSPHLSDSLLLPPRPRRSSEHLDPHAVGSSSKSQSSQEADSAAGELTLVAHLPQQSPTPVKLSKAAKQASQLASIETSYNPMPSAFSRDPELTPNARDSFSTNKSGTSSSFYPPSTSTVSGHGGPSSPQTTTEENPQPNIALLTEEVNEMQEYNGDDVAYRLRLLVKNNYFLPPAHMKPSPEDFGASMTARKPSKATAPAFLDIFRVGKSKSKPTTPVTPAFSGGPMLRTTSDSITASFALRNQTRSPHNPHHLAHPPNGVVRDRGRVVVVRERMNNIAVAAKQAEQEMKTRNARCEQGSDRAKQQEAGDVIDPTDVVDVPLPSSSYPFAVQASALHGLGVQDSVGAAVLADRLPPNSPGMSSCEADDSWRKALLREAVHHSLDNSPDISMFSHGAGPPTPTPAQSRINGELPRAITPGTRAKRLQQHITNPQSSIEPESSPKNKNPNRKSTQSQASTSKGVGTFLATPASSDSRRSSYLPVRMATPLGNLTPLSPAPRKQIMNVTYSISQTDLQQGLQDMDSRASNKLKLRRSMSTPMFSEISDGMRHEFVMTPPPPPLPSTRRSSQMTAFTQSFETTRDRPSIASVFSSQSHFDIDDSDDQPQRTSVVLSVTGSQPSLSIYSQSSLSPTTSAFQEVLNHAGDRSTASSIRRQSVEHTSTEEEARTRSSIASPPPRPSTSIAHVALRPPPRTSSFNYSTSVLQSSVSSPLSRTILAEPVIEVGTPSPITFPNPPRRDNNIASLALEIPTEPAVTLHSPAPSSPTSFFDTLQAQHSAMDDLDSSEESDDGEEEEDTIQSQPSQPPPPPFVIDPRARANSTVARSPVRPPIMRLGNFSTPYIGRTNERPRNLPIGIVDSKKALGFIPAKAQFFSERKSDLGHGTELTTLFAAQAQSRTRTSSGEVVGGTSTGSSSLARAKVDVNVDSGGGSEGIEKRRPMTTGQVAASLLEDDGKPESLREFDGMLVQHMEAEKDRIKKIASTLKSVEAVE